jgi:enoyl-CoA hydratase
MDPFTSGEGLRRIMTNRGSVTTARHGAVLTVTVRNEPFNFLTGAVTAELAAALHRAERDPAVRAVVLAGAVPGVFIGHYDIGELLAGAEAGGMEIPARLAPVPLRLVGTLGRLPGVGALLDRSPVAGVRALLAFHSLIRRIQSSDKVYVAAIGGSALGGGFELALACDVRVIGDGPYEIGLMESAFGLVPGGGGSQVLTRAIGASRTTEMLLEGRLLDPKAAAEAGIVHHVVDQDAVMERALAVATRLARRPAGSVRAVKKAVHQGGSGRLSRGLAMERALFLALAGKKSTQALLRGYQADVRAHHGAADLPAFLGTCLPAWQSGEAAGR